MSKMVDARNVILVSHAAGLCGAERSLLDLASGMHKQGLTPIVIVRGDGPLTDELVRLGIEYHPMHYHAWIGRGNARLKSLYRHCCNLCAANRAAVLFKGRGIAMVYINTTVSPFGAMLAKSLKVPAVWHLREWLESFDGGTAAALKTVDRYADLVIANSDALRLELERYIPAGKVKTIHNGPINWSAPDDVDGSNLPARLSLRLCMVGTIYADKGHADALRLLAELRRRGIEAELEVVGEGRETFVRELKKLASTLGVGKRVIWSGFQKDSLPPLRHAHICLVCSRREAFGRVAVEAMSVGTPVVATAVGGLTEIIRDGETGLFYKPGEVDRLADAVESLVENHDSYGRLALAGMRHVHGHFTVDIYRQKMIAAFEMVIGGQKL